MRTKLQDSIYIPSLADELANISESTPEPGIEQARAELIQVMKHRGTGKCMVV